MKRNFEILSINRAEKRGVYKKSVGRATLRKDHGVVGDGHAGPWPRQVSLLASEDVEREAKKHAGVRFDYFTENITTRGVDLSALPIGAKLHLGNAVVEITQIGKEEQHHYTIEEHPREWVNIRKGVFAKVVKGGDIDTGSSCHYNE